MEKERRRRHYDREFKAEAVRLITERGLQVSKVAGDLGIDAGMLCRWRREYLKDQTGSFPGKGYVRPREEELIGLRKENADLREERDIFKKALGIFSRQRR